MFLLCVLVLYNRRPFNNTGSLALQLDPTVSLHEILAQICCWGCVNAAQLNKIQTVMKIFGWRSNLHMHMSKTSTSNWAMKQNISFACAVIWTWLNLIMIRGKINLHALKEKEKWANLPLCFKDVNQAFDVKRRSNKVGWRSSACLLWISWTD